MASTNPSEGLRITRGIWKYSRGTADCGLIYKGVEFFDMHIHCDASFSSGGSRSRTAITIEDNLIAWRSNRQSLVAYSATESELEATVTGIEQSTQDRFVRRQHRSLNSIHAGYFLVGADEDKTLRAAD